MYKAINSGDVKYHLGTTNIEKYPDGKQLTVTLLANPSHLEAVSPVVIGRAKAD
jgi:2-oxoglutarate dehydrogenase E1 component